MKLLGVDYGTKNIGLARASTDVPIALPFGIIDNADHENAMAQLLQMIQTEGIEKIIVGLPFGLDGSENENTKRIRNFFSEMQSRVNTPVEFINEMFSSHASDRLSGGASRDEKSAMIILQNYLDRRI
jgi:putative Holliday junction resolvase